MGFWSDLFPGWLGEFTDAYFTGYQYIDTANSEAEIDEVTKQKIDALTSEYLRRLNPEIPGDFVGNEMLAALPIGLGRQIGRIETWRDKDWFAIPVLKGYDYIISLFPKDSEGSIPIDGWLHAAVYDADGKELEWRQPSQYGNPTEINYSSENDGAIFVRMSPYYPYYYGDYEVDIAATRTSVNTGTGVASDITGSSAFQEGVTLTAPLITGDPDGNATNPNYAYQWFKGSTAITNQTASTYAVPASGAGTYKVAVTYTDAQGFTAMVESPEQVVSTFNNGLGTPASITGNGAFQEGVTLTAPVVTADPDGDALNPNYAYQWFKGSTAITNATASTYAVPASGAGTYKVAVTYTDAQGFIATLDSPEQVVIKPTSHQVEIAPSQRGSLFRVENAAVAEVIVNLKGSPDLIEIDAEVSATLYAVATENWSTSYVALNVGSTLQAGTGERVSLNGLGKYSFVATAINAATSTIVLEQDKNTAFFLHDAYSAFYEGLTLSADSTGRQSAARILDFDVIKMGSAGGNSIVDLTSKDYIAGAVAVHGADKGRSIFWGTDSDDTFLSGGGDSVIFGGGGFNQSKLGAGKDVLQFRSTVDSTNLIQGFDPAKDVLELWRGRTETVEAPIFITDGNSTTMTWGSNAVQFEGLTGITAESLLTSTRFAV